MTRIPADHTINTYSAAQESYDTMMSPISKSQYCGSHDLDEPLGLSGGVDDMCLVDDFLFLIESRLIIRAGANESSRSSKEENKSIVQLKCAGVGQGNINCYNSVTMLGVPKPIFKPNKPTKDAIFSISIQFRFYHAEMTSTDAKNNHFYGIHRYLLGKCFQKQQLGPQNNNLKELPQQYLSCSELNEFYFSHASAYTPTLSYQNAVCTKPCCHIKPINLQPYSSHKLLYPLGFVGIILLLLSPTAIAELQKLQQPSAVAIKMQDLNHYPDSITLGIFENA